MAMIDSYRNNVIRKKEELAKLSSDKARENDKIAKARQKIDTANSAIRKTSSNTRRNNTSIVCQFEAKGRGYNTSPTINFSYYILMIN